MTAHVNLEELLAAFEWMSAGEAAGSESEAFVSKATGSIHWSGDAVDEELPEDIEDEGKYVTVPRKSELDLGRPLALRFVDERLPGSYELARQYFGKRGAYARFKAMLERAGQLEAWYEYEERAIEEAMIAWADENGFVLDRPPSSGGT